MGRNPERLFDKTHLSIDLAEERQLVHRDYIAHCLRWSHTLKLLHKENAYKTAVILDVGCGKEMPLAKALYTNKMSPTLYIGVDINKMTVPDMLQDKKIPIKLFAETDFCAIGYFPPDQAVPADTPAISSRPDFITSFEVLEHVTPAYCRAMLTHMRNLIKPTGKIVISTPCYNGEAAQNHINEMTHEALGAMLEDLGFSIDAHYGTFASISDYKNQLGNASVVELEDGEKILTILGAFEKLREYYDSNLLSIIFAPLFPEGSRNCLWELSKNQADGYVRKFPALADVAEPWSQHAKYRELNGEVVSDTTPEEQAAPAA
jgi:2-polyprenyl-3-methyl-5-hydroxy-6-metoxy-1,4-benzoquinol methylase